jgi:5-formyltetrahydrofolate cyclo-ligase
MDQTLNEAKKKLREAVLSRRDGLSAEARATAAIAVEKRFFALDAYYHAHAVMAYMSFGTELDTAAIVDALFWSGKTVVLPRVDRASKSLKLHRVESRKDLIAGVWDILEPRADLPTVAIDMVDLVLMPGVAFDLQGHRLGYGAGFYDRLLAGTAERPVPKPLRVAATLDCQVVDAVPAGPNDQSIHILITETRFVDMLK